MKVTAQYPCWRIRSFKVVFPNLQCIYKPPREFLNAGSDSVESGWGPDFVHLMGTQLMSMMLVSRPV